jgi:hypothetical protein
VGSLSDIFKTFSLSQDVLKLLAWNVVTDDHGETTDRVACVWCRVEYKGEAEPCNCHPGCSGSNIKGPVDPATALHDFDCKLAEAIGAPRRKNFSDPTRE